MPSFVLEYVLASLSVLLILTIFIYILYKRLWSGLGKNSKLSEPLVPIKRHEEEKTRWINLFNPLITKKTKQLRRKREHKIADRKHLGFFTEFWEGERDEVRDKAKEEARKVDIRLFNKIKKMAKHSSKKNIFMNLEEAAEKMKEKEKKLAEKIEIKGSISKLKKMLEK